MAVYILLPPAILGLGLLYTLPFDKEQKKKFYLTIAFGILFFLTAFRAPSVGTDTNHYEKAFLAMGQADSLREAFSITTSAPVYVIVCRVLYRLFPHGQALPILSAFIICVCMAHFIYTFCNNVVVPTYCYVTLWFFAATFNINRQYMALSLFLLALCFIQGKKRVRAYLTFLIAVGVHNTAFLCIPFLVLFSSGFSANRRKLKICLTVAAAGYVSIGYLFYPLASLFADLFPRYAGYLGETVLHPVTETGRGDNIYLSLFYLVIVCLTTVIIWKGTKNNQHISSELSILYILSLTGVVLGLGMASNLALSRVRIYFEISMCCLIPYAMRYSGNLRIRTVNYLGLFLMLLIPYAICLHRNLGGVVPYQFFWEV